MYQRPMQIQIINIHVDYKRSEWQQSLGKKDGRNFRALLERDEASKCYSKTMILKYIINNLLTNIAHTNLINLQL